MQLISEINEKMRLNFRKIQIGLENRFDMVPKKLLVSRNSVTFIEEDQTT